MAVSASIKVCDPASVPASILADLNALRAELRGLRQENERLRQDIDQTRRLSAAATTGLRVEERESREPGA
jgi:hypothetical protein